MSGDKPIAEMAVTEVLRRWPQTAEIFHQHQMACVGCPVAPYYTIYDAATVYGLSPAGFVAELEAIIKLSPSPDAK